MKEIVLFYSLSGVTGKVAKKIAEMRDCDIVEIKPTTPYTLKTAFSKGVVDTKKGTAIEIEKLPMLNEYQCIFLGTPIWAFGYAAPLNAIFEQKILDGKKVILFSTSSGLAGSKSLESVKVKLNKSEVLESKNFSSGELKKQNTVSTWIDSIKVKLDEQ